MIDLFRKIHGKRGQVDKIISTFPVMLLVFLLMAVFLFLSVGAKGIKQPAFPEITINVQKGDNLLLKEIEISMDEQTKKMFVFDAVILVESGEIKRDDVEKAILELSKREGKCAILIKGHTDKILITRKNYFYTDYDWRFNNGWEFYYDEAPYREKGLLNFISVNLNKPENKREDVRLIYYYGGCLK